MRIAAVKSERDLDVPDDVFLPEFVYRSADIGPATYSERSRTLRVTWSTGAAVPRRDARGAYLEVLSLDPAHVDLTGLRDAPVLDGHNTGSTRAILGIVQDATVENGVGLATLRFSGAEDVEPIVERVRDGTIRAVSVGYAVSEWRETTDAEGRRVKTAIRWRPREISLVTIGADPGARIRSQDMPDANIDPQPDVQNRAEVNASIRSLATRHALGTEWADGQIDAGADVPAARAAALAEIERRAETAPRIRAHVGQSNDDPAVIATRCADALAHRMGAPGDLPAEAVQYRGLGLQDMLRTTLAARGERVIGLSAEALLTRAMTTGDLPNLLQSSGHRTLLGAYQVALSPVFQMFRQTTATDFRTMSRIRTGEMDPLEKVAENGEVTRGGFGEVAESFAVETYARIIGLTRQAIINDDLGAFAQMAAMQGRAAAEKQNAVAVALLTQGSGLGPTMHDGQRLFHSTHGNVAGTGTIIDTASLAAAVLAMRVQKGVDGVSPINVVPRFLLVSPAKELQARQAVAAFYPATQATVNPMAGTLTVAVDPRLSGNRWYLFCDPAVMAVLEYAYLASAPGPQLESRAGWDVLGMEFRVVLDFGCGAIDWRGAYTNAGA